MKLLHVIYTDGIAGAEKHLINLLPGLKNSGVDCEVLILCPKKARETLDNYINELTARGINCSVITSRFFLSLTFLKRIANFLKRNHIVTIHSHLLRTDLIMVLIKLIWIKSLLIISTKHGYKESALIAYSKNGSIARDYMFYLTKFVLNKIDYNLSISKGMSFFFKNTGLSKQLFHVIPHGINIELPVEKDNVKKYRDSEKQIIIVGRLEEYKGHTYAFKAFKKVLESFPTCTLVILGKGSHKRFLKEETRKLKIENNVRFLGFQSKPHSYIKNSDVIIVPSIFEPFGLVFIEAMAIGTPVVTFNTPAGNEIIEDNKTGYLVEKENSFQMGKVIIKLLSDEMLREGISKNAQESYSKEYTSEAMVKRTLDWYHNIGVLTSF